jgi:transcriptional regulator with XRE-family HTH domain
MDNDILAKRLKKTRDERGYLQKFVADKIGVKSNTLSGYETGTRTPDPEIIRNLATLYDVTTDYLLGHSDDPRLTKDEDIKANKRVKELMELLKDKPDDERARLEQRILDYAKGLTDAD